MIRLSLLALFVTALAVYSFKDWYRALCGLILLVAVVEHPDMPKTMFGIQGLNPWNILLLIIVVAWLIDRARTEARKTWDLPRWITVLLLLYLGVMAVSTARLFLDPTGFESESIGGLVGEYVINTFKWLVPGALLFIGCRSRERFYLGLASLIGVYVFLGVQVVKWMPLATAISGESLGERSLKILSNEVGFHRVNLSMMLAGASWAALATRPLFKTAIWPVGGFLFLSFAQALTGGRMGYVTWAAVGGILCLFRWRKYLLLAPAAALAVVILAPGVVERMLEGFTPESRDANVLLNDERDLLRDSSEDADVYTITAGRTVAWPLVVQKIGESPVAGFGRQAMIRVGLTEYLWTHYREAFGHPHNAYLEALLDNGLIGFVLVVPLFFVILLRSLSLFRDSTAPEYTAVGGVTAALVLALLVASVGSQTFYPREGAVAMWCAIGLMYRLDVLRSRQRAATAKLIARPAVPAQQPRRLAAAMSILARRRSEAATATPSPGLGRHAR